MTQQATTALGRVRARVSRKDEDLHDLDVSEAPTVQMHKHQVLTGHTSTINGLALSPDGKTVSVSYDMPAARWQNGENTVRFRHLKTHGFRIERVSLAFDNAPPPAPPATPAPPAAEPEPTVALACGLPKGDGRTLFIAPDGAGGADGVGTEAKPFKTFTRAASALRPGDTLILKDGTYTFAENSGDPDTVANLGPLAALAGTFEGEGTDEHPVAGGTEIEPFVERYELAPIDRQTNGPQLLYGLRYHTHIVKPVDHDALMTLLQRLIPGRKNGGDQTRSKG